MTALYATIALVLGGGLGFGIARNSRRNYEAEARKKADAILEQARQKERDLLERLEKDTAQAKGEARREFEERSNQVSELEKRLRERERLLDQRSGELDNTRKEVEKKYDDIIKMKEQLKDLRLKQEEALVKIARMSEADAKDVLLKMVEKESKDDLLHRMKELDQKTEEEVEQIARVKIATVINRLASDVVAEATIKAVNIPNEEMKGRLIGKEGRNIQAFEKLTGVDLLIDDTPGAVILSSFNPLRRETARVALEALIQDGRINPNRIEEVYTKAEAEVGRVVQKAGESAAVEAKVSGLSKEIMKVLGQLKFRTSYGQNVLTHSIEVSRVAGLLAQELHADINVCRKAGLLHDLGKALDRDIQAPHHHISADIAKKYGMSDPVVHAIMAHHDDVEPKTVEAWIVRAADAISSARPGARRGTYEEYVERLQELENIALGHDGVDKAFAIQAGRELRVLVNPKEINDLEMARLAKKVARQIEEQMQYPGQVKVNVIRETRAQAVAE